MSTAADMIIKPTISLFAVATAWLIAFGSAVPVSACPFCDPVAQTYGERIAAGDVALIAKLIAVPADDKEDPEADGPLAKTRFGVERILQGEALLEGQEEVSVHYYGKAKPGALFLLVATNENELLWSVPEPLTSRGVEYIVTSRDLPKAGPKRLEFFQEYLEDEDTSLDRDAYNEFALAPYEVIVALKDKMPRDKLIKWIRDPQVEDNRRRLYLTLLGVCGSADDVPLLEELLESRSGKSPSGLDALVACYLKLKGAEGVPLIEDRFLKNQNAEFSDTYAAITALRFVAEQTDAVPRPRVAEAFYHMLDRPDLADLVIVDLARWEDWSVMDRLADLFRSADDNSSWVRQPIARYLMECPLPEAKQHLAELKKVDAQAIQRAGSVLALLAGRTRGAKNDVPAGNGNPTATTKGANTATAGEVVPAEDGETADDEPVEEGEKDGNEEQEERPAGQEAETAVQEPPPSYLAVLGIPFAAGCVLFAVLWFVLAGVGGRYWR